ncbi:type III-B CRISPR module RAMP protein Cmr1 [Caldisericum sp.]|uniref:type III-B CRISPR module RAMP protein Cmr1 n=1 Tax=Caldisericum sp. TaxID=2499687 RepID=UPI003D0A8B77
MRKKEVTVGIEFITPAFIGGANPNVDCEMREDSLKGALRFWWRAFCSTRRSSEKELLEEEGAIFGGQKQKSKVSLFIPPASRDNYLTTLDARTFNNLPYGIQYLLFPFRSANRKYINPGTQFEIQLIADDDNAMIETLKALWFLENFGGLGARSRRGLGSFRVIKINSPIDLQEILKEVPKFMCLKSEEEIGSLQSNESIQNYLGEQINIFATPCNSMPSFSAYSSTDSEFKVHFEASFTEWKQPLNWLGRRLKEFRSYTRPPFNSEAAELHKYKDNINGYSIPDPLTKTAFGLPIVYNFRDELSRPKSERISIEAEPWSAVPQENPYGRRASPLFFKVGKIGNSDTHYYVTALLIWSEFLPNNARIKLKPNVGPNRSSTITPQVISNNPTKLTLFNFLNENFR